MEIRPGLRRTPPDDRPIPESEPAIVARLRADIAAGGPITFARFMAIALADPEHGYYATADDRPSPAGDFVTAPELHPIFGTLVGRALEEQWRALDRPARFVLREYGAGRGTLAESVLAGLAEAGSELLEAIAYEPVDLLESREDRVRERLATAGFGAAVAARPGPSSAVPGVAHSREGAILANEFLDALPVHRVAQRGGRLVELLVDWTDRAARFVEVEAPPTTPALAARLAADAVTLADGQVAEIRLATDDWVAGMSARLERGFATILDYGRPATELYGPARRAGTLRAYSGQRAHADPYIAIGRQDLTAHVDFTAVERAAAALGWRALGLTTQAEFLMGSGFGELFAARQSDPAVEPEAYLALRAAAVRLLDPAALGGFRVLTLARGVGGEVTLGASSHRVRG